MRKPDSRIIAFLFKLIPLMLYFAMCNWLLKLLPRKQFRKNIMGQTVLITGAGSGIGRELAIEFSTHSTKLVLVDINKESLFETQGLLDRRSKAFLFQCDVSKREKVYEMAKIVHKQVGKIDILVNNAGIVSGKFFTDLLDEDILKTIEVNILAHFWFLKAFLPNMIKTNKGHIISVSSQAGLTGLPKLTDYCSSKFAVVGLMESLQRELECQSLRGIKTTTVCPSLVSTGLFQGTKEILTTAYTPREVALEIMNAVLEDKDLVLLPQWMCYIYALRWLAPNQVIDKFNKDIGVREFMGTFTGRPKIITNETSEDDILNDLIRNKKMNNSFNTSS